MKEVDTNKIYSRETADLYVGDELVKGNVSDN